MKKYTGFILGGLLFILVAVYTGYWFYAANQYKKYVEGVLAQILLPSGRNTGSKSVLTYSSISLKGYPFSITLQFNDVNLQIPAMIQEIDIKVPHATLTHSLFDRKNLVISYDTHMQTQFYSTDKNGVRKLGATLFNKFEKEPRFVITLGKDSAIPERVIYDDHGESLSLANDGEVIITKDKTHFDLTLERKEENRIHITVKGSAGPAYINTAFNGSTLNPLIKPYFLMLAKTGPLSQYFDLETEFPLDFTHVKGIPLLSLNVNEIKVESPHFTTVIKGDVHTVNNELFPVGNFNIEMKNFPLFLEIVGNNIANGKTLVPAQQTPNAQSSVQSEVQADTQELAKYDVFIRRLSSPKGQASLTGVDMALQIKRDPMNQTLINGRTIPEVITVFQDVFGAPQANPPVSSAVTPAATPEVPGAAQPQKPVEPLVSVPTSKTQTQASQTPQTPQTPQTQVTENKKPQQPVQKSVQIESQPTQAKPETKSQKEAI